LNFIIITTVRIRTPIVSWTNTLPFGNGLVSWQRRYTNSERIKFIIWFQLV